jgi:hypothetical protein
MHVAFGVRVVVDLMTPDRWLGVSCPSPDPATVPLLRGLVGDVPDGGPAVVPPAGDTAGGAPWLRVAVVEALDRWLHTPLLQCLLDAERGVARGRAARTLPPGPVRAVLTGEALGSARRSSRDLVKFLRRLGRGSRPVPAGLVCAVNTLVDGYAELIEDVAGPDRELGAVIDAGRRLVRRLGGAEPTAEATLPAVPGPSRLRRLDHAVHLIDPRQVRARVLALSADPAVPEVEVSPAPAPGAAVVRVRTFGPTVDPDTVARLLVRLVDRRSGEARGHALLRAGEEDASCLAATVPLYGRDVRDVRADVADALSDLAPAADDADEGLCEARRAVVFLAEWRRLAGLAQLGAASAPARQLRRLAGLLQPGRARSDLPLFIGGPSSAELEALADLGDDGLSACLKGEGPIGAGLRAMTAGSAALLVAEVAALFATSAT